DVLSKSRRRCRDLREGGLPRLRRGGVDDRVVQEDVDAGRNPSGRDSPANASAPRRGVERALNWERRLGMSEAEIGDRLDDERLRAATIDARSGLRRGDGMLAPFARERLLDERLDSRPVDRRLAFLECANG